VLVAGAYTERLYGISTRDGTVLWSFHAGNFINSHCVADGTAYLWSPTGWVYAVDTATGLVRWRHKTTDYGEGAANWAPVMAELAVEGGCLYALAMDQVLHVLDAQTGEPRARLPLPEPVRPAVLPIPDLGLVFATMQGDLILAHLPGCGAPAS
jgi:outer membrane protein assembly factor BamB